MHGVARQILILLCLFGFVAANIKPFSSKPRQSKSLNYEPDVVTTYSTYKRFKDSAPTLVKIFQVLAEIFLVIVWILDGFLSILLWVLNEVVRSSTDFSYKIFAALFNIVKLLEALGFGIKFLLEINFSLVSYVFDTANVLQEYFRHAVTLVKISLANETDHMYESGSMVLEGVQHLFVTPCWSRIVALWDKVNALIAAIIDNFDGFPKPNLPVIANSTVAATRFFFESVVITAGVISDGLLFLLCYIGEVICDLHTSLLGYIFLISTLVFKAITMITQCIILLVTLPFHFLASIVDNTLQLLYSSWQVFTKQCCWLDEKARCAIQFVFQTLLSLTMRIIAETLNVVNLYIPGGAYGLLGTVVVISIVYTWRRDIISLFMSAWSYYRVMNSNTQDENARVVVEEEFVPEQNDEPYQNNEPGISGETDEDQHKLIYELEKEKDKRLCVICQDKLKTILLLPCRHVCLCHRCYQEIKHNRVRLINCPLCRRRVQSIMEVFV